MIEASMKDGNLKVEMVGAPIDLLSEAQTMYIAIVEDLIKKSPDEKFFREMFKLSTLRVFKEHL